MTAAQDYYASLGVERAASKESIIAAFRRLAMKWHPDRHVRPADKVEAEKQFKLIKTAYETLCDDSKRERYDRESIVRPQTYHEFTERHRQQPQWGREYDDRNRAEAERQRRASAMRGTDVNKKVAVTIAEAYNGTRISFEETVAEHCGECEGQRGEWVQCGRCQGFLRHSRRLVCQACQNSGKVWVNCEPCTGLGVISRNRKITVRTPAGLVDGSVLTVKERGKASEHGGLPGDLHIAITIKPETGWKRKGIDLSGALKLPYSIALLGGLMDVPLPTGRTVQVDVPARCNTGKKIRLAGQGLFDAANDKRGDVVLSTSITLPASRRKLTPEMEALLKQIDGIEP
ncbi:DnaJ C-terminal domain-containing protein [Janthinobacterium sp. 17J80-10]|uniref:DnaJ C-terminal domain-containing protein n=1 Tax=Janthinobacterium sp. 17J80-10 TaxID=2497863 RepID=UPI0010056C3B|nr:DnaJ C-terminal domain-containing protein [Janthinobacterium sp. 17J80-10]QAU33741.1 hypothetical protein EKL02_05830 [Janthinobacterium sp. 17J80-10]